MSSNDDNYPRRTLCQDVHCIRTDLGQIKVQPAENRDVWLGLDEAILVDGVVLSQEAGIMLAMAILDVLKQQCED